MIFTVLSTKESYLNFQSAAKSVDFAVFNKTDRFKCDWVGVLAKMTVLDNVYDPVWVTRFEDYCSIRPLIGHHLLHFRQKHHFSVKHFHFGVWLAENFVFGNSVSVRCQKPRKTSFLVFLLFCQNWQNWAWLAHGFDCFDKNKHVLPTAQTHVKTSFNKHRKTENLATFRWF